MNCHHPLMGYMNDLIVRIPGYVFEVCYFCIQFLGSDPPPDWPSRGEIKLDKISVRYADTLPAVIKDVSLYVRPGEKVGIIIIQNCITFILIKTLLSVFMVIPKHFSLGCKGVLGWENNINNYNIDKIAPSENVNILA